jgi:hypothetical protein
MIYTLNSITNLPLGKEHNSILHYRSKDYLLKDKKNIYFILSFIISLFLQNFIK